MEIKRYYEDYHSYRVNTCPHRSYFIPYSDEATALAGNRNRSERLTLLNGVWGFAYYTGIHRVPAQAISPAAKLSSFEEIKVPACWQLQGYDAIEPLQDRYDIPIHPPYVPAETPVGVYVRDITVENAQDGQHRFLVFEGVDNAFYLYINGILVGYSSSSHALSEFDCTPYLKDGVNRIAVLVFKWSVSTYLECQDPWRLSGIFRDVYLLTRPAGGVRDVTVTPTLSVGLSTAEIRISVESLCPEKITFSLYDPQGENIAEGQIDQAGNGVVTVENPLLWSAETPHLYTLLTHFNGEFTAHKIGLRTTEIDGGVFKLNGRPIKLKGVARYNFCKDGGYTLTYEQLKQDVLGLKQANINALRTADGPCDPRFYELCDRYGIYVLAQGDLNACGYLEEEMNPVANAIEFRDMILDRMDSLVMTHRNHPCVVLWAAGTRSGYGSNLRFALSRVRELDPTRPALYQGADFLVGEYPPDSDIVPLTVDCAEECAAYIQQNPLDHRPLLLWQTAPQGNSCHGLDAVFHLQDSDPRLMGVFLANWRDNALQTPDGLVSGKAESSAATQGLLDANNQPYPTLSEVKAVYAPFLVAPVDVTNGDFTITNQMDFGYLSRLECVFEVTRFGKVIERGSAGVLAIPPQQQEAVHLDYTLPKDGECYVSVIFRQFGATSYAKSGTEVGRQQFLLPTNQTAADVTLTFDPPVVEEQGQDYIISANGAKFTFSCLYGTLTNISCLHNTLVNTPAKWQVFRAPTPNDRVWQKEWLAAGYDRLLSHCEDVDVSYEEDHIILTAHTTLAAAGCSPVLKVVAVYRFYGDGKLAIGTTATPLKDNLPPLPRMGLELILPKEFDRLQYYGYGPAENDSDRNTAAYVGNFTRSVHEGMEPYLRPQSCGNHHGFLLRLTNGNGVGLAVWQNQGFDFSALPYTPVELMEAEYNYHLPDSHHTVLHLDGWMRGVGTHNQPTTATITTASFTLKPITKEDSVWLHYIQQNS